MQEIWTRSTHSKNFRSAAALVTEISQFEVWCCLFFFAVTGALTYFFFSLFSFRIVSAIEWCSNSTKLVRFILRFKIKWKNGGHSHETWHIHTDGYFQTTFSFLHFSSKFQLPHLTNIHAELLYWFLEWHWRQKSEKNHFSILPIYRENYLGRLWTQSKIFTIFLKRIE